MARCARCNKFMLFSSTTGFCKSCDVLNEREAEEKKRKAEEQRKREEELRRKAEEERRKAEEEQRRKAEEEQRRKAEEEQRRKVEEERRKREVEQRRKAEEERRKAEEEQRQKAEAERKKAEERAQRERNASVMKNIAFGSTIEVGKFAQDGKRADPTPISWIVLAIDGSKALLLSKYAIDEEPFHGGVELMFMNSSDSSRTTWAKSTVRNKLNGEFFNNSFSDEEKEAIITSTVKNDASEGAPGNESLAEPPTMDKVFLLSFGEAERYLGEYPSSPLRMAKQTKYCRAWGNEYDALWRDPWWLRSLTAGGTGAQLIDCDGTYAYQDINRAEVALRPAMWVDLSKLDLSSIKDAAASGTFDDPAKTAPVKVRGGANAKRVMLVQDMSAMLRMFAGLAGGDTSKTSILGSDEIAYKGFPAVNLLVTAQNGKRKVLKNNLEHLKKMEAYSIDTSCAYVMPEVTHELEIENGDTVDIELA